MRLHYLYLALIGFTLSCHSDDIQNQYTIQGKVVWAEDIEFNLPITIHLLKGDEIISTVHTSQFTFSNLEEGAKFTVLPLTTAEGRNGLSTLDYVQVQKHLQGQISLDLFQKIAADVNLDNSIGLDDIEIIQHCIVSSPKLFECPGYRFVSAAHDEQSFMYIDRYETGKINSDHEVTFIPIKLGDLNNTIHP